MYYYFYIITNNLNGKYYYGVHSTENLNDGYMGSGTAIKAAQELHGIENFTKEIVRYFDSADEMFEYEEQIVNQDVVNNPQTYNLRKGGRGSRPGTIASDELRRKLSLAHIGVQAGENHPLYGKHHSDETKKKISNTLKGNIPWNKGLKGVQGAWNKGKIMTDESKEKNAKAHRKQVIITETFPENKLIQYNLYVGDIFDSCKSLALITGKHQTSINYWRNKGWVVEK